MKLQRFDRTLDSKEVIQDFREGRIHFVFVAVNALTYYNVFAGNDPDAGTFVNQVNAANRTRTRFPTYCATTIPLTIFDSRDDFGNVVIMEKHLRDCFAINEERVKCPNLVFALEERPDFDRELAYRILPHILFSGGGFTHTLNVFWVE